MLMEIKVCIGSACYLKGSYDVIGEFQKIIALYKLEDKIKLKGSFCMNQCTEAVSTTIDDVTFAMSVDKVRDTINSIVEENKWNI